MLLLCAGLVMVSCNQKSPASKMLSEDDVKISGVHKDLLSVDDSVRVVLVCLDEKKDKWDVRVIIPMTNTRIWKRVPGIEPEVPPMHSYTYFEPKMGDLSAEYLDEYGTPLNFEVGVDFDVIHSLLASGDTYTPEDFVLKSRWESLGDHSYKTMKAVYDKVARISISKADLNEVHCVGESSSSASIYDAYEDVMDQAARSMGNAIQQAADEWENAMEEAVSSFGGLFD